MRFGAGKMQQARKPKNKKMERRPLENTSNTLYADKRYTNRVLFLYSFIIGVFIRFYDGFNHFKLYIYILYTFRAGGEHVFHI